MDTCHKLTFRITRKPTGEILKEFTADSVEELKPVIYQYRGPLSVQMLMCANCSKDMDKEKARKKMDQIMREYVRVTKKKIFCSCPKCAPRRKPVKRRIN